MVQRPSSILTICLLSLLILALPVASPMDNMCRATSIPEDLSQAQEPQPPGIIGPISTGIGIITGLSTIAEWGDEDVGKKSTVTIDGFPKNHLYVDVGMAYDLDYKVKFSFIDNLVDELAFFELYLLLNNNIIYYERNPEKGYLGNLEAFFGDSVAESVIRDVSLGAKEWDCGNTTDTLQIVGVLWEDPFQLYKNDNFPKWIEPWQAGIFDVGLPEDNPWTRKMNILAKAQDTMRVTVTNPYYVEELMSDNEKTKNHDKEDFQLQFEARMHVRNTYPKTSVRWPSSRKVTINPLDSNYQWSFKGNPELQFTVDPKERTYMAKPFQFYGRHTGPPDSHKTSALIPYIDNWGATVEGTNSIWIEKNNKLVSEEFNWKAKFKPGAFKDDDCTPIPYRVWCYLPLIKYTLSLDISGRGTTSLSPGSYTLDSGTVLRIDAFPDPGWEFDGWSGDAHGDSEFTVVTLDKDKSITANFRQKSTEGILKISSDGYCDIHRFGDECQGTITLVCIAEDLTNGTRPITRVVVKNNGTVLFDSDPISKVKYTEKYSFNVECGKTYNFEIIATNSVGQQAISKTTVTCPKG